MSSAAVFSREVTSLDDDLERRFVATLLRDPDAAPHAADFVAAADIGDFRARRIFELLMDPEVRDRVRSVEGSADTLLITRELKARGELDTSVDPVWLAETMDLEPGSASTLRYARELRAASLEREIRRAAIRISQDPDDLEAHERLAKLRDALRALRSGDPRLGRAAPYQLIPFAEAHPGHEEAYLVKGLFGRGHLVGLIGAPGTSKTFSALDIAFSIAVGVPWRGLRVRRGRVVYVAAEGGRGVLNRLEAIRRRKAFGDPTAASFFMVADVVRLMADSDDVDRLVDSVRKAVGPDGVDLVVIDTLSRAIAGLDENSSEAMTGAVAGADRIRRELGAAVLLVHHAGKDETRGARGHSSLKAALDVELELKRIGETFFLTLSKSRDHESGRTFAHLLERVEIGVDDDGDPVTSCVLVAVDDQSAPAQRLKLDANEQRTLDALRALLAVADGTSLTAPDSAPKEALRQWVERNAGVSRALRRNVVLKGLKGLQDKGIVSIEGERVFLSREDLS